MDKLVYKLFKESKEKYAVSLFGGCDANARNLAGEFYDAGIASKDVSFVTIKPKKGRLLLKNLVGKFEGWNQHVVLKFRNYLLDLHLDGPVRKEEYFNLFQGKSRADLEIEENSSEKYFVFLRNISLD